MSSFSIEDLQEFRANPPSKPMARNI